MADQKVFAGPRLKRFRLSKGLSQTAMAQELGVSPSYLNLIERNQRPLTVQLILKLSQIYKISADDLLGDTDGTVASLKAVFSDPLLQGELPGTEELFELADVAPNVSNAVLKLHGAYREVLDQLSDLNAQIALGETDMALANPSDPYLQANQAMESHPNYYEPIELAAEALMDGIDRSRGLWAGLVDFLLKNHHISVQMLPQDVMPDWRRRFEKHSMRLFISDTLSHAERLQELAGAIGLFALSRALDSALLRLEIKPGPAAQIARGHLADYAALAILMPYRRFFQTARRVKYNLQALCGRFETNDRQVALRLTSLQRKGQEGVKFSYYEIDHAANLIMHRSASGSPPKGFDLRSARLGLYALPDRNGAGRAEIVEARSGEQYLAFCKSVPALAPEHDFEDARARILLICDIADKEQTAFVPVPGAAPVLMGVDYRPFEFGHQVSRGHSPYDHPARREAMENAGDSDKTDTPFF